MDKELEIRIVHLEKEVKDCYNECEGVYKFCQKRQMRML